MRMGLAWVVAGVVAGAALLAGLTGCQSVEVREHDAMTAAPLDGWADVRNVSRAGEFTFAGQPTEASLRQYAADGGAMVIDLRTHQEHDSPDFDEAAEVKGLGMSYVNIPMSPASFSAGDVDRLGEALDEAKGPVLLHCGTSNRVGGMWAAYLARKRGWSTEAAMEAGRAAGMRSEDVEEAARRVISE